MRRGSFGDPMALSGLLLGFGIIAAGIAQVVVGQLLRSAVDTADNTRQMLEIMRR